VLIVNNDTDEQWLFAKKISVGMVSVLFPGVGDGYGKGGCA